MDRPKVLLESPAKTVHRVTMRTQKNSGYAHVKEEYGDASVHPCEGILYHEPNIVEDNTGETFQLLA